MNIQQQFAEQDVDVRRIDYEDSVVFAADFGDMNGSAEVVDDTVIVATDGEQYDLELTDGTGAQAFMKNGVLTIEVNA